LIHEESAWLLRSRINPAPVPGVLSLEGGRISFTLVGDPGEQPLDWLEESLGEARLAERLAAGERIPVFDHPVAECSVSWPITGAGATMIVRTPDGGKWYVSCEDPAQRRVPGAWAPLGRTRTRAREWKRALVEAGAS
jgi:hypothetical protein